MLYRNISALFRIGLFGVCSTLVAQQPKPTAHIAIEVQDPSGASIPKAHVDVLGAATTVTKKMEADDDGKLSIDLPIGAYEVTASYPAFRSSKKRIEVQDTRNQTVTFMLNVAVGGRTVEVFPAPNGSEPTYASLPDELQDESNISLMRRNFDATKFCLPCPGVEIKPAFTITISTPESVVDAGSNVKITITMTNTSDRDVFYGSGTEPVEIRVLDSDGKSVAETPKGMKIHGTEPNRQPHSGSNDRLFLKPGTALSWYRIVSNEFDMKKPGNYTILAQRKDTSSGIVVMSAPITVTVGGAVLTEVQLDSLPVDSVMVMPPLQDPEKSSFIEVIPRPTAESFALNEVVWVQVWITNNAPHPISFHTCPGPYTIHLRNQNGLVPPRTSALPQKYEDGLVRPANLDFRQLPVCTRSTHIVIGAGESEVEKISLSDFYDLKDEGPYTGYFDWRFTGIHRDVEVPSTSFHFEIRDKRQR